MKSAIAATALVGLAHAASPTAPMSIAFSEFDLANGLHVIVHEDHATPLVAVDIRYHVGSKNEEPGKTGFAHLFEHLMFDGSRNVGRGMFDTYLTNVGAQNNAYTTADETNYHDVLPVNQLELALWLESDRMMQFAVGDVSLATQKNVVKEEKRESNDNRPYGSLEEKMHALAYDHGCYRWPVIGSMDDIDRASMADVRAFFETYYVPDNAVLCLAGDITPVVARELAERWFGDIPRGTRAPSRPAAPPVRQGAARVETVHDDVPAPAVFAAFVVPPEGSDDDLALDLLTMILGSGESSRLYHHLVYEKAVASDAGAYVDGAELSSLAYVYAMGVDPETDIDSLQAGMFGVVDAIARSGVTDRELEKAKNQKTASLAHDLSSALGRADALTHAHTILGGAGAVNAQAGRYARITAADVQRVARDYLGETSRNIVRYIPKDNHQ